MVWPCYPAYCSSVAGVEPDVSVGYTATARGQVGVAGARSTRTVFRQKHVLLFQEKHVRLLLLCVWYWRLALLQAFGGRVRRGRRQHGGEGAPTVATSPTYVHRVRGQSMESVDAIKLMSERCVSQHI
jgi:hypothetical protein